MNSDFLFAAIDSNRCMAYWVAFGILAARCQTIVLGQFVDAAQPLDTTCFEVSLGDLDGDGDLDAWLTCSEEDRIVMNAGNGTFLESDQIIQQERHRGSALGDLDGDGDTDVFVVAEGPNTVFWNDGNGQFTRGEQALGNATSRAVVLADIDGDGDLDAIVGNSSQKSRIWMNDGLGKFTLSKETLADETATGLALGDLDRDGNVDVLIASDSVALMLNNGDGSFSKSDQEFHHARNLFLRDIDRDGDLDIWFSNRPRLNLPDRLWLNNGSGQFTDSGQMLPGVVLSIGDLDGDGDLDALMDSGLLLENKGNGILTLNDNATGISVGTRAALGDLDGDTDLDVWLLGSQSNRIFLNNEATGIQSIRMQESRLEVRYFGTLLASEAVDGDYVVVESASSPYLLDASAPMQFFRAR